MRLTDNPALISATSYLLGCNHNLLLSIDEVSLLLIRKPGGVRVDVTRRPEILPWQTRIGHRVYFKLGDVLDFINDHRAPEPTVARVAPPESQIVAPKKRGRPTSKERFERLQSSMPNPFSKTGVGL